jgi:hypothetical protein
MAEKMTRVEFNTDEYVFSHGHSPKGYGSWAFVPYGLHHRGNYLDYVKWFNAMTYGDAKRAAAKAFAAEGVDKVVVCS